MYGIQETSGLAQWAREKRAQAGQRSPTRTIPPAWRDFRKALGHVPGGLAVIAEPARRSPEEGHLRDDLDLHAFLHACERARVAAVAIPTDARFGLTEADLHGLEGELDRPILHHDLVVAPEQLAASRALGADAVWLHAAVLGLEALTGLLCEAQRYRLQGVVEVDDEEQLHTAQDAGATMLCFSAFGEDGAQNLDHALELADQVEKGTLRIVRGPVSGEAGLEPLRGRADAIWICGPAVMPRDTAGYLKPLVEHARRGHH